MKNAYPAKWITGGARKSGRCRCGFQEARREAGSRKSVSICGSVRPSGDIRGSRRPQTAKLAIPNLAKRRRTARFAGLRFDLHQGDVVPHRLVIDLWPIDLLGGEWRNQGEDQAGNRRRQALFERFYGVTSYLSSERILACIAFTYN